MEPTQHATIVWWSDVKTSGLVQTVDNYGVVRQYFLLASKIVKRPAQITANMHVYFAQTETPNRPGLLPLITGAVVSEHPLDVTAGKDWLVNGAVPQTEVR